MQNYRNNVQIIGSILEATEQTGQEGIHVTPLIAKSNLSHPRLKTFLEKLTGNNLINDIEVKGKHTFVITQAGRVYLEEYKRFSEIAGSFGFEL